MKLKLLLFLLTFSFLKVSAQHQVCRASQENEKVFKANPKALQEKKDFDAFTRKFELQRKNGTLKESASTYVIPVVFHIYGEVQSGSTVTYQKIVNHLAQLNDDFNGRNADYQTVEPFFQARRGTLNIEFKLAKIDPKGGCTTGVVFHKAKNGYGNGSGYDKDIAAEAWDNKKYMNIYIQNDLYNEGSLTNSGVAWYPDISMTEANTARVVFNGAYLYDNSYSKEFSATLTHEFGHFLNLIHTFEGGCSGTDEVADTPKEDGLHSLACTPGTNCDGDKVNIENYMGYNGAQGCYKMYTQGQITRMLAALQHPARITLWQPQNLIDTGVNATGSTLVASTNSFKEGSLNDGSFTSSSIVNINGAKKFALTSGTMVAGIHFTHTLPAGITPVLTVNSNSQITVTLTGKATAHTANKSASGGIAFLPAAFAGGTTGVSCSSLFFNFKFIDPYGIFYVDMPDATVSSTVSWKYFEIAKGDDPSFGVWRFAAKALKIETYDKKLVCQAGTKNISLLGSNVIVGPTSNFAAAGAYPNQLDLRTATYTAWDGKTGYVGFDYLIDGETCYGWLKVTVDANGDGYTVSEYAYNTQPGMPVYTGMTPKVSLALSKDTLYESDSNDGAVTDTSVLTLATNNGTFTKSSGAFTVGTHYTITGVPSGLTAALILQSSSKVSLSFTGKATSHIPSDSTMVVVEFKDAAITGGVSVLDSVSRKIKVKFDAPYGIFNVNNPDYSVSSASDWQYFDLEIGDNTEYGVWRYGLGALKIETYDKRLVCQTGTRNITFIAAGTSIGPGSTFVAPGAYPDELDLRTPTYKTWDNKTGYVGFEYESRGRICYGWFHIKVDANGDGYTLLDYAYNTKPNDPIIAGQQSTVTTVLAPSSLVAVKNDLALNAKLTWVNNETNATNVIVERAGANNVFSVLATLASTVTTYTDAGLTAGTEYKYKVRAKKATDYSDYSEIVSVLISNTPTTSLDKPALGEGGIYSNYFYITWILNNQATGYEIELKNAVGQWVVLGSTEEYYFYVAQIGSQVLYDIRVRAKNATEFSAWSYATFNLTDKTIQLATKNYSFDNKLFTMYPNPASDVVQFNFNNLDADKITLTIYNITGKVVDVIKNASTYTVNHLAKGMYIVVATDGTFMETKKLLVK